MKLSTTLLVIVILFMTSNSVFAGWGRNVELVDFPIYKQIGPGVIIDDHLFSINGLGLVVLSVEDIENISVVAHLPLPNRTRWIANYEEYIYLSVSDFDRVRIYIIDVSEPRAPEIVNIWADENLSSFWFHEDRMYMFGTEGLVRYSLDDPVHPEALPHPLRDVGGGDIAFQNPYAVTSTGHVIDISGDRMIHYSSFETYRSGKVAFSGDVICMVTDDHLRLYSFSHPERVTLLSDNRFGGNHTISGDYWIQGNYAYLRSRNRINVVSISDPENPSIVEELLFEELPNSNDMRVPFARIDNSLFVVDDIHHPHKYIFEKIQVIDVSNPRSISVIGEFAPHVVNYSFIGFQENNLLANTGQSGITGGNTLNTWNINDWRNPVWNSLFPPINEDQPRFQKFLTIEDLCYIHILRDEEPFLDVASYRNPEQPQLLSELNIPRDDDVQSSPKSDFVAFNYHLYVSTRAGVDIYNIEDPENPEYCALFQEDFRIREMAICDSMLVTSYGPCLYIYDLTSPAEPRLLTSDTLDIQRIQTFTVKDDFICAFFAYDSTLKMVTTGIDQAEEELIELGVSPEYHLSAPTSIRDGRYMRSVIGDDGTALFTYNGGLLVFDIEDPFNPHLIAEHPSLYKCVQPLYYDGQIVMNDMLGVAVFDLLITESNPITSPEQLNFEETLIEDISEMTLNVSNSAEEGLIHVTGLEIEGDGFSVRDRGRWLTPEEEWQVAVTFQPAEEGNYEGTLLIEVEGNEVIEVSLSGGGVTEIVTEENTLQPLQFEMHAAYPNPFNAATTIIYTVPKFSHVELRIYDIYGRSVETLFAGVRKSGIHRITWNGSDLPSGLYFVRLKASDQVFTQKVMLIK